MADFVTGSDSERIGNLERANRRWCLITCVAVAIAVYSGAIVFSRSDHQPNPTKGQPPGASVPSTDHTLMPVLYVNQVRASLTPEEIVLDLAVATEPTAEANGSVSPAHRVALSYQTAKRLSTALHVAVQRHESTFGPIELNPNNRKLPGTAPSVDK